MKTKILILGLALFACMGLQGQEIWKVSVKVTEKGSEPVVMQVEEGYVELEFDEIKVVADDGTTLISKFQDVEEINFEDRDATDIDDIKSYDLKVSLTNGEIYVEASEVLKSVELYTVTGTKLTGVEIGDSTVSLNVSELSRGIYVLKTLSAVSGKTRTFKLVK